jgi:hypothetical protein
MGLLQCGISSQTTPLWVIFDRAARRLKSRYVGSGSNNDRILCAAANGGQCHEETFRPKRIEPQADPVISAEAGKTKPRGQCASGLLRS